MGDDDRGNASMDHSDTRIHRSESETALLRLTVGQEVRVGVGFLKDHVGTVIEQRAAGRVLVRLQDGVYVEIHQFCLETTG